MNLSFNLTTEPWIPCERLDGTHVELSTLDTLAEAHSLRAIDDSSPLVLAALHRHLLAILHRSYAGPKSMKEWAAIAGAGKFDRGRVDAYLGSVRDRMDLFHPTHPFAQTRGLIAQFDADPIDALEIERSSWGGARELFRHRPETAPLVMAPARAARALLAHHAFATGGLVRKPGEPTSATAAPLVRCALVLLRGATLFDTLRSNLLRYDTETMPIPATSDDAPSWEQPPPPEKLRASDEPKRMPRGWLDLLTWLSRRIELVAAEEGVTGWVRAVGQGLAVGAPLDPMVTYRLDEKLGIRSVGIDPRRAFWRNASALFEVGREGAAQRFRRPLAVELVGKPAALDVLGRDTAAYSVDVYGLSAEKSRVDVVRADHIHVLARQFDDPAVRDAVERALQLADAAIQALRRSLNEYARRALSPGEREPDSKDVYAFVDSTNALEAAWSALGLAFETFLRALGETTTAAEASFAENAVTVVNAEFVRAAARSETTARWLKARALAERSLRISLAALHRAGSTSIVATTEDVST